MRSGATWKLLALAVLGVGLGACSEENDPDPILLGPTNLQVQEVSNGLQLTWSASTGAESYSVERDVVGDAGGYAAIASGLTATSHVDEDVEAGHTYQYRVLAVRGSESAASAEVEYTIGLRQANLSGVITANRTLRADTTYILQGTVQVDSAATLTIEPGTLLLGDAAIAGSSLVVRRGGKVVANGTADAPIVFTSSKPAGSRARGDWGGVVINGLSTCNFPASECVSEGFSLPYGGNIPDDSSGVLRYVRIEFAGYEVSFGNELNALTLNAVGSRTKIEYIQVHYGSDDGIEWFGGTVDVKYALATGISDDSFDYSTGWTGRGQFWIAQQDPNDADNGFEVDNNEENYNATPRTAPTIYNITLVGKGSDPGTAGESTNGLLQRRGTAGKIYNAIVIGFGTSGLEIDDADTYAQCAAGNLVVASSIVFGNANFINTDADDETACTGLPAWTIQQVDPLLAAAYNRNAPDFRPAAGSPALSGAAPPPADGFFSAVDFIGAVDPAGTPWYQSWTTFAQN